MRLNLNPDPLQYNQAMSVLRARTFVDEVCHFSKFLEQSAALFQAHDVTNVAGVFLVHRHNKLPDDAVMIETQTIVDGDDALVTRAVKLKDVVAMVPTRWSAVNGDFQPFEYSDDLNMSARVRQLEDNPAFLTAFEKQISEHDLSKAIGLCLFDRELYSLNREGCILVESTDESESSNVVRWMPDNFEHSKLIQTVWRFGGGVGPDCVPICVSSCYFSSPDDKHGTTHDGDHGMMG